MVAVFSKRGPSGQRHSFVYIAKLNRTIRLSIADNANSLDLFRPLKFLDFDKMILLLSSFGVSRL